MVKRVRQVLGPAAITQIHEHDVEARAKGFVRGARHVARCRRAFDPVPDDERGMRDGLGLPATMGEHPNARCDFKQASRIGRRLKAIAVRPGISRERLRVTAYKQTMRLECFRFEDAAYPREKLTGCGYTNMFSRGVPARS